MHKKDGENAVFFVLKVEIPKTTEEDATIIRYLSTLSYILILMQKHHLSPIAEEECKR